MSEYQPLYPEKMSESDPLKPEKMSESDRISSFSKDEQKYITRRRGEAYAILCDLCVLFNRSLDRQSAKRGGGSLGEGG